MNETHPTSFVARLQSLLAPLHLLKHPFYQDWTMGRLSREDLRDYARQYFHHVDAFPRYVSATHSQCADLRARQVLLENLMDEERGPDHHPELWLRFAEGLGATRESVAEAALSAETRDLVETFFALARQGFPEGLGALFAYEQQVPEVAGAKIDGLRRHYSIEDERTLKFFKVHLEADVYHSRAVAELMESLTDDAKARALAAAERAAHALWRFMDGVQSRRRAS